MGIEEWAAVILSSVLGTGVVGAITLHVLRRPRIRIDQAVDASWAYRYEGGEEKTGLSVWAGAYLSNHGAQATDVTGGFIIPGTQFDERNPLPADEVCRIPENTGRQRVRYSAVLPIDAISDEGETMRLPLTLRLSPMGHRRLGLIGKRFLDVPCEAAHTSGFGVF